MRRLKNIFLILLLLFLSLSYFNKKFANRNKTIATLCITGKTSIEDVEWKLPFSPLQQKSLPTYEVILSIPGFPDKKEFFFGEIIGVRYKTLELYHWLHWLGFENSIEIEALCSDYISNEKRKSLPCKTVHIEEEKKMHVFFWKHLFKKSKSFFFVKKATLKAEYFPLMPLKKRSFSLIYKSGELQSSNA